jgi:uncharacterized protein YqgC (DUF456 family)
MVQQNAAFFPNNQPTPYAASLMSWIAYIIATGFGLVGLVCVLSIIVSVPGTWLMVLLALLIELVDRVYLPAGAPPTFGWPVLAICGGLALLGEIIETAAGAAGARGGGGTRRGMIGAIIGGIIGAIVLTPLIPILLVGTMIGALLGTFAGAVIGEVTGENARTVTGSMKPAVGATIGRVIGTLGKIIIATVVWIVLTVAAFV